jgi:hypothetical protein
MIHAHYLLTQNKINKKNQVTWSFENYVMKVMNSDQRIPWEWYSCSENTFHWCFLSICSGHQSGKLSIHHYYYCCCYCCQLWELMILWRARCRSTVNSGNACWQQLLGKHHVTCFLCRLTPACYATMGRLCFLRGLFRGNNSQCNSGCFLCGLFTGYIRKAGCQ